MLDSCLLSSSITSSPLLYHIVVKISLSVLPSSPPLPHPNISLISSITIPVAPLSKWPYPHTVPPACFPIFLWYMWLLIILRAVPWIWLCLCFHTMLASGKKYKLVRGSASGKFPAPMDTGELWKCGQSKSPKQNIGNAQRASKVPLKTACLLQPEVYSWSFNRKFGSSWKWRNSPIHTYLEKTKATVTASTSLSFTCKGFIGVVSTSTKDNLCHQSLEEAEAFRTH